jgi:WD40 repeat protein
MARLRRATPHQEYQSVYGNRAKVKADVEARKEERNRLIRAELAAKKAVEDESKMTDESDEPDPESTDSLRGFFPTSFGTKPKKKKTIDEQHSLTKRKAPPTIAPDTKENPPMADEDDDDGGVFGPPLPGQILPSSLSYIGSEATEYRLPISHEVTFQGHNSVISAISVDRKGARVLTGSYDEDVRMWDFAGMNHTFQSFRTIKPEEGHQVRQVQYSISADRFLVVTGSCRPKIYDREGVELCQFVRGDMYLHDRGHTYGHVTAVVGGWWHPANCDEILTCSIDGTLRIWDVNVPRRNKQVLKLKDRLGKVVHVTACAYSPDGKLIAGAGYDGSLQIFNIKNKFSRAEKVPDAHESQGETSCVSFANDNVTLLSRGADHTLKVWDVRKFKNPLKVWANLENTYQMTDAVWSPDSEVIVTGTSNKETKGQGRVIFFSRKTLKQIQSVSVCDKSVIRLLWHPELNQIFAGCSDKTVRVLYNPELSQKGVTNCVGKQPRRKDASDFIEHMEIRNPHALNMYKDAPRKKGRYAEGVVNPTKARIPHKPKNDIPGKGIGGALASRNLTAHFMKQMVAKQIMLKDQDPRAEILKFAELAQSDPKFLGPAYSKTQPKPIFRDVSEFEEEDEKNDKIKANVANVSEKSK